ncbi:hypothetical protein KBZ08_00785 [Cyanobium sp. Candia 9D4]|uniref:hypothetical protein n=1 Tax=Cyanobium sp. Candia 9D4 TaxID=2823707 RepID=UPI0020CD857E|nr:hypothetical protein [Cyanobium sp. Candia 9D4]MCP9932443.1 hypothetical protein [Cyanobium sp. Candia 9D4]
MSVADSGTLKHLVKELDDPIESTFSRSKYSGRIEELRARTELLQRQVSTLSGGHFECTATLPNGNLQVYHYHGIKDPGGFRDQVVSLVISVWSFKDHFIKALAKRGISRTRCRNLVFRVIRKSRALIICLDLANAEKHSGLDNDGWSRMLPELGEVSFTIPNQSIDKLVFGADRSVVTSVAIPEEVHYSIPVVDHTGSLVGDAIDLVMNGLSAWESFEDTLRKSGIPLNLATKHDR